MKKFLVLIIAITFAFASFGQNKDVRDFTLSSPAQTDTIPGIGGGVDKLFTVSSLMQAVSISNDTVYLENGGFIVLPDADDTNELQSVTQINDSMFVISGTNDTITIGFPTTTTPDADSLYDQVNGVWISTNDTIGSYFIENGAADSIIVKSGITSTIVNRFKSNGFGLLFDGRLEVAPGFYVGGVGVAAYGYGGSSSFSILDLSGFGGDSTTIQSGFTSSTNNFNGMRVFPSLRHTKIESDSLVVFKTQTVRFVELDSIQVILDMSNAGVQPEVSGINDGDTIAVDQHYINVLNTNDTFRIVLPLLDGSGKGNEYVVYHEPQSNGITIIYVNDTTTEGIEHDAVTTDSIFLSKPGESVRLIPDISGSTWGVISWTGRYEDNQAISYGNDSITLEDGGVAVIDKSFSFTGWAIYSDTSGTQVISDGDSAIMVNDIDTKIETYLPSTVDSLFGSDWGIVGELGSTYNVRTNFTAEASVVDGRATVIFDFGGGQRIERVITFARGANIEHPFSLTTSIFALSDFVSNGCKIWLLAENGNITISNYSVLVDKLSHR